MTTDPARRAALAHLAADAYSPTPTGIILDAPGAVRCVVTELDGALVATFRGTRLVDAWDDLRDLWAVGTTPRDHPTLGRCHAGMLAAAEAVVPMLLPLCAGRDVVCNGHSLGGGEAICAAGLLVEAGARVTRLVTWEAPRAGTAVLRALLAGVAIEQFRRGDDPVTDVPWWLSHMVDALTLITPAMPTPLANHFIAPIVALMDAAAELVEV